MLHSGTDTVFPPAPTVMNTKLKGDPKECIAHVLVFGYTYIKC